MVAVVVVVVEMALLVVVNIVHFRRVASYELPFFFFFSLLIKNIFPLAWPIYAYCNRENLGLSPLSLRTLQGTYQL